MKVVFLLNFPGKQSAKIVFSDCLFPIVMLSVQDLSTSWQFLLPGTRSFCGDIQLQRILPAPQTPFDNDAALYQNGQHCPIKDKPLPFVVLPGRIKNHVHPHKPLNECALQLSAQFSMQQKSNCSMKSLPTILFICSYRAL